MCSLGSLAPLVLKAWPGFARSTFFASIFTLASFFRILDASNFKHIFNIFQYHSKATRKLPQWVPWRVLASQNRFFLIFVSDLRLILGAIFHEIYDKKNAKIKIRKCMIFYAKSMQKWCDESLHFEMYFNKKSGFLKRVKPRKPLYSCSRIRIAECALKQDALEKYRKIQTEFA